MLPEGGNLSRELGAGFLVVGELGNQPCPSVLELIHPLLVFPMTLLGPLHGRIEGHKRVPPVAGRTPEAEQGLQHIWSGFDVSAAIFRGMRYVGSGTLDLSRLVPRSLRDLCEFSLELLGVRGRRCFGPDGVVDPR